MPKYDIPAAPPSEEPEGVSSTYSLRLPINGEIAETLGIDDEIEVRFKGVVKGIERDEFEERTRPDAHSMRVDLSSIAVYTENEWEQMAREDEEES